MSSDQTCSSSSWTKEEDKAFENALAIYSGDSDLLMKIAAAVPQKSLQEITQHYNDLVEDVNDIESGKVPLPKYGKMQSYSSHRSRSSRAVVERRKGIPWTAEEHRLFLQGLEKYGKGDWRGISRNCVRSRTATQVASHVQKFFNRLNDNDKSKRRSSIHDITSVNAADTTESSQGPIIDYVTEAFDTGMIYLPGLATNCAIEAPSAVNPEKFPLGAAVGSELNNSFPDMDEFLQSIDDLITEPAESTSGAVAGGTGMYTHPVVKVGSLEELMTNQLVGSTQVDPMANTTSLPLAIVDQMGVHDCIASGSGAKNSFESTMGAPEGGFRVDSLQLPSIPGTNGSGIHPFSNPTIQLPSIPGTSCGGTNYHGSNPSSEDDDNFDLEDLFSDPIFGFGK
ncbi:uncharacterized protein LOC132065583 [Lycium ferocissimum]|uniref:uncharacterized protein LOC132065583 n=1 Tax=Lycium ferocissimum TaxID=112874 RepID=UPI0028157B41|nr:uncharacterized protein LOC132065583 [Lycium ferocissimum]